MTLLYLIRHARSSWNAEGRAQGQTDIPLDEVGRQQARALAARLQTETFAAFYSSPLVRARETAEIVAAPHQAAINFDSRLQERHFGEWEGLIGSEIEALRALHPERNWRIEGPLKGESRLEIIARADAAFADILAAHEDPHQDTYLDEQKVVVISHGGLLSMYFAHLIGVPLEAQVHFPFGNAALARLHLHQGHISILALNDDRHLERMRSE